MDSRPSAARFILSLSKGGNDELGRIRAQPAVVQRSLDEGFVILSSAKDRQRIHRRTCARVFCHLMFRSAQHDSVSRPLPAIRRAALARSREPNDTTHLTSTTLGVHMHSSHQQRDRSFTLQRAIGVLTAALVVATISATASFSGAARAQIWNLSITGFGGKTVVGSGKAITEPRVTQPFIAIAVKGAADVVIRQTGKSAVEVSGDDNIVPLVTTEVKGETLVIDFKDKTSMRTKTKLVVRVDVAALTGISISGSGNVVAEPIKADALDVSISGSGDLRMNELNAASLAVSIAGSGDFTATGAAAKQRYSIAGSGDVKSSALKGNEVSVSIAGSGDASVWAKGTLSGNIVGSGDIRYLGDATVSKSVLGSGSMKRM